jgi:hypothetical protein
MPGLSSVRPFLASTRRLAFRDTQSRIIDAVAAAHDAAVPMIDTFTPTSRSGISTALAEKWMLLMVLKAKEAKADRMSV